MDDIKIFMENKKEALDAIFHFDMKAALEIGKEIDYQIKRLSGFPGGNKEELDELSTLSVRLKLLIFPLLKDDEAMRLIKESAIEMVNDPDLVFAERIEARQLALPESMRFEMVNKPIMEALHENIEQISKDKIFVTGAKTPELSTVKNWFLDYDRTFGTEPQKDLTWLDFVKKNAIVAHLNPAQADTLRKLLKLYEFLKVLRKYEYEEA